MLTFLGAALCLAPPFALEPVTPEPGAAQVADSDGQLSLREKGALLFALGYVPALFTPMILSPYVGQANAPTAASNYTLVIPVFGPIISGIVAPATNENGHWRQVMSGWSAPWLLTSGVVQLTGVAMMLTDVLRKPKARTAPRDETKPTVALLPWIGVGTAGLSCQATVGR